jgi:hypothetical protein
MHRITAGFARKALSAGLVVIMGSVFSLFPITSAAQSSTLRTDQSLSSRFTSERQQMTPDQYREWLKKQQAEREKSRQASTSKSKSPTTPAQQQPTRRTYQKPVSKAGARAAAPRSTYKIQPINMSADPTACVMYLDPMDVTARKDEMFTTKLALSNPKAHLFNRIFIALTYDPEAVRPVATDESPLKDLLSAPSTASVYEGKGLLLYEANLKKNVDFHNKELMEIRWRAIGGVRSSAIKFATFDGKATSLSLDSADILGDPGIAGDGVVGTRVTVLAPGEQDEEIATYGTEFYDVGDALGGRPPSGDITLELRGAKQKVKVGEEFLVNVYYNNPRKSRADSINLDIRFNPEVLQVVDYDEDNWITHGVNIFDGAYHERFPFDYLIEDRADNIKGEIAYQMGASNPDVLTASGTFATIRFRARATSDKAGIYFVQPQREGMPGTSVQYLGRDVLGDVADHRDGTRNFAVAVVSQ